jgi:hypothetical protein
MRNTSYIATGQGYHTNEHHATSGGLDVGRSIVVR